jgi:dihydrofolate reductase
MTTISIIVAIANGGAIGANNDLLWHLPNDLKRFKSLTTGHTVIMGRKTFESLPKGALPNRTNVVITRNRQASFEGCEMFDNLSDAINNHQQEDEIFIIGGAQIYEQAIALTDKLYITYVQHTFEQADVYFPEINKSDWVLTECIDFPKDENHPYPYLFKCFLRKKMGNK